LASIRHHQREVLIEWGRISRNAVRCDHSRPHPNYKRSTRSGRKPDALNIVDEVLLSTGNRVLSGKMVPFVDDAGDYYFKIELIDQRRICRSIAGSIRPRQHHSKLVARIADHSRYLEGRPVAFGEGAFG